MELNQIYNMDCVSGIHRMVDCDSIDLVVTSPPYNIGIDYIDWNDSMEPEQYWSWCSEWLKEVYASLKPDGRIVLNCLIEANYKNGEGRIFVAARFWEIMQQIGYKWAGFVYLKEIKSHRVKHSAWGSYLRPSAPYCYNAAECLIIAYKQEWKKEGDKEHRIDKDLFLECVQGEWEYSAVTRSPTKACFSEQIPHKAICMFTYPGDTVMDVFSGSGTTCAVAKKLGRNFVGFEISPEYWVIGNKRVNQEYMVD